jgi:hypothetical protein
MADDKPYAPPQGELEAEDPEMRYRKAQDDFDRMLGRSRVMDIGLILLPMAAMIHILLKMKPGYVALACLIVACWGWRSWRIGSK